MELLMKTFLTKRDCIQKWPIKKMILFARLSKPLFYLFDQCLPELRETFISTVTTNWRLKYKLLHFFQCLLGWFPVHYSLHDSRIDKMHINFSRPVWGFTANCNLHMMVDVQDSEYWYWTTKGFQAPQTPKDNQELSK